MKSGTVESRLKSPEPRMQRSIVERLEATPACARSRMRSHGWITHTAAWRARGRTGRLGVGSAVRSSASRAPGAPSTQSWGGDAEGAAGTAVLATLGTALAVVSAVALVSCLGPARRDLRIEPTDAVRAEA
jgi:hypothetical protein